MLDAIPTIQAIIRDHAVTGSALNPSDPNDAIHQLSSPTLFTFAVAGIPTPHPQTMVGNMFHLPELGIDPCSFEAVIASPPHTNKSSVERWQGSVDALVDGGYFILYAKEHINSEGQFIKYPAMTRAHLRMLGIEWIDGEEYLIRSVRPKAVEGEDRDMRSVNTYVYVGRKTMFP